MTIMTPLPFFIALIMVKANVKLVDQYMPLIRKKAFQISCNGSRNEYNDLVSAGTLGFMQAVNNFKPQKNVKFVSFAWWRISGAMLDYLREAGLMKRSFRGVKIISLPEDVENLFGEINRSFNDLEDQDLVKSLINKLKPRNKLIIIMWYKQGMKQTEIADIIGVSNNRIGQLIKDSIKLMRIGSMDTNACKKSW